MIKVKRVEPIEKLENKWHNNYNPMYYYPSKLMSYDPKTFFYYIAIGSRGRGKTTAAWRWVLKRFLKHKEKFVWLRLTEAPIKKASRNQGKTLVPPFILKQLKIESISMRGTIIYMTKVNDKGEKITTDIGIIDSISTFYTSKGQDMSAYTNVVFDEINRESGEKTTFDITRAFINQIETIARFRLIRVLMLGNTITDISEILGIFDFQPREFGIYKLTRKHAIIEYMDDSEEFKKLRAKSLAGTLLKEDSEASVSFINKTNSYSDNLMKFSPNNKQLLIFFISEFKALGVFKIAKSKDNDGEGLFIGEVRLDNQTKYRISPYMNCEGIYDKDIYTMLFNLMSTNKLYYESPLVRTRFTKAMKLNKTSLT